MDSKPQSWVEQARQAREKVPRDRPRGAALQVLTEVAAGCGTTRAALRNGLAALRVAEEAGREDPVLGQRLLSLPVTLVEAYGRWRRIDPAGAARAVEKAADGGLSVRAFVAAEKAARPVAPARRPPFDAFLSDLAWAARRHGRARPNAAMAAGMARHDMPPIGYDLLDLDRTIDAYDRLCGLTSRAVIDPARLSRWAQALSSFSGWPEPPEAELLARWRETREGQEAPFPVLGIMEVEVHGVLERFRLEAKTRYLRAAAAAAVYPAVIVLLPSEAARAETLALWPDLPYGRLGIDPPVPDRTQDASRPPVFFPGRGHGAVVVTSPETMWEDLCRDGRELRAALERDRPSR